MQNMKYPKQKEILILNPTEEFPSPWKVRRSEPNSDEKQDQSGKKEEDNSEQS